MDQTEHSERHRQALEEIVADHERTWGAMDQHSAQGRTNAAAAYGDRCYERALVALREDQ